ncbi:MAG: toll/interleukin-1 receptor domain-containing protein [Allosphingosinicella sp.]|uniref:toll/interleukin-1 receptor domain-containing protein n=1 Tax=Allosphingosinicella sp. TaxID=2823234 RepID=UPI00395853C4
MADVFLSYARPDEGRAAIVAEGIEAGGRSLWWDRRLASGDDYGLAIEREIDSARCVVVAWSKAAHDSLWVRAEANAALDAGKLVQLNFDGARLPLPFTMIHFLDFHAWTGAREQAPWPELESRVDARIRGESVPQPGPVIDAGGVEIVQPPEGRLQGFDRVAILGWASLGATLLVALCVLLAVRNQVSAAALGLISVVALAVSLALLGTSAFVLGRTLQASRR